ncbi:hypothetical protein [Thomasclavelia spiroformis]|uniref:hypothetical protein n=1 Tax=Thomasclavelia spiroformis TaxID=29348 RepID=UPI00241CEE0A|nr:hypothetical protein [Thomasclavelia spiroformis]MBS6114283.1 hypothetical protein [Thomasclavelia spiroformis]
MKLIDKKWQTHKKVVMIVAPFFNFTKKENCILKPLREAHKRQGTYWEKAYQAVKHDRYSSLHKGNVKAFIHALAALYLLNIYYRNESWITKYNDISKIDYSMGSAVFTVKSPVAKQIWYDNDIAISDSPYVVRYKEDGYQHIKEIQENEKQALNDYWNRQPELSEPEFQKQLNEAKERERKNPQERVIHIWELAKYRLNKKIPEDLPFEERRKILLRSEEWNGNGWINQNNEHLSAEEITEDNIQEEIDKVAIRWGMELAKRFEKLDWIPIAMDSEICRIYIPW